eukprot:CAMPEP_0195116832 /NCGR_PEP_ID=MMETSP0448-20130528/112916_1 /TAXON_ID=66468 /ORGANISM="Heterocapsa triquestra, Strain CCMP 448" /LENGTH=42 /DNA_ID= /DNA_START= /DNA_END= /DNA_ORIENTATION=
MAPRGCSQELDAVDCAMECHSDGGVPLLEFVEPNPDSFMNPR